MRPTRITNKRNALIAAIAIALAISSTGCTPDRPTIVTDIDNKIVDVRNGVRWDVIGIDADTCDHIGGMWDADINTCQDVDY